MFLHRIENIKISGVDTIWILIICFFLYLRDLENFWEIEKSIDLYRLLHVKIVNNISVDKDILR